MENSRFRKVAGTGPPDLHPPQFIAALLLAATLGCAHSPPAPEVPASDLGERIVLRTGESRRIAGTQAKITFERILSDNRCAIDVVCIVAGEARASIRLEAEPGRTETFTLDSDRNATAEVAGYQVTLLSVSPAPRSTVRIDPKSYAVEVTIQKGDRFIFRRGAFQKIDLSPF